MSWREVHAAAVRAGQEHYTDPGTGYLVFTEVYLRKRARCCGSGCRHCPFDHERVPEARRVGIPGPVVVSPER